MSWQEHEQPDEPWSRFGGPGGDWQAIRPTFDNPMSWSIPLFRISGIQVRIHILFLLFIIIVLIRAAGTGSKTTSGPTFGDFRIASLAMVVLFFVVLAHELGHCLACRRAGGDADEILLWPLGGLAFCQPANQWKAHLVTVLGGPLVNVLIIALAAPVLGAITGIWWTVAIPNPIEPLAGLSHAAVAGNWALMALYLINATSVVLLALNLVPMFPLDGGRLLQAIVWRSEGYVRSMQIAVRVGYIGAILLALVGFVMYDLFLVAVAAFGAVTCYITGKQLEWTEAVMGERDEYAMSLRYGEADDDDDDGRAERAREREADRKAQREQLEAEEVDRILQKISTSGMDSLTKRELRLLKSVSDRKRRQ
jgi:Zn-dependent protease